MMLLTALFSPKLVGGGGEGKLVVGTINSVQVA